MKAGSAARALLVLIVHRAPTAAAACPAPAASLETARAAAEEAYEGMDAGAFAAARDVAREALGCQDARVAPPLAAVYHRLEALDAYLSRDHDRARAAFRAALSADPETALPLSLAPEANPLRALFDEARALSDSPGPAAALPEGRERASPASQAEGAGAPLGRPRPQPPHLAPGRPAG